MAKLPTTLDGVLDPAFLSQVLERKVTASEITDPVQVNFPIRATVVRFRVTYEDGTTQDLCVKGFLDRETTANAASLREVDFYNRVAGKIGILTAPLVAGPLDRDAEFGLIIMRDMIPMGARFSTALEPFTADRTSQSLETLAKLHNAAAHVGPVEDLDFTFRQIDWLADYLEPDVLQGLLDDPRKEGLPSKVLDARELKKALRALAVVDAKRPASLVHGDCHAGNVFQLDGGAGFIDWQMVQQGGWQLDVAYHIAATLPVEVAEKEERNLVRHYLEVARGLGREMPNDEDAWEQVRMSFVYGYYLWAITRAVPTPITYTFVNRLGNAVARHDSYKLLGL